MKAIITTKKISEVLEEGLNQFYHNPCCEPLFVFPREVEKNSWIKWVLNESGKKAVATDFFIAWDDFKRNYILPPEKDIAEGKTCIPPLMRKVFAQEFLERALKEKQFKRLINHADETHGISAFTDWLSGILPSLKMWDNHYKYYLQQKNLTENTDDDGENLDMKMIFRSYQTFLEKNKFYEPSYADVAFNGKGRKIYIFYPQINDDFSEYYDVLIESPDVVFVSLSPDSEYENKCIQYSDARKELRRLALELKKIQMEGNDLRKVSVTVPDLENIRPYVEREFRLYGIPYVVRDGLSFTKNNGGDIFGKIKDCIDSDCDFESVRNLLSDGFIPWKNTAMNLRLIQAGAKLRCICSVPGSENSEYTGNKDIWEESLKNKAEYTEEFSYYLNLRKALDKFRNADSFEALQNAWIEFRDGKETGTGFVDWERFLDKDDDTYRLSNRILGQMLTQLMEFASVEKDYMSGTDYRIYNYLDFFVNEMESKKYNENSNEYGVNVFSYRISSCADYEYQFIINASQDDITVPVKALSFITDEEKRESFGLKANTDDGLCMEDASSVFVALYGSQHRLEGGKKVYWSSSRQNFNGAAITHTALDVIEAEDICDDNADETDIVRFEREKYMFWQKDSFLNWKRQSVCSGEETGISENLKGKISQAAGFSDNIRISASKLNSFFPCPKKWLYQNVMGIDEEKYFPKLAESNEIGTISHKVMEILFEGFIKNNNRHVPDYSALGYEKARADVTVAVDKALNDSEILETDIMSSNLGRDTFLSQKNLVINNMVEFVMQFCSPADEKEKSGKGHFARYYIEGTEVERTVYDNKNHIIYHGFIDCILSEGGNPSKAVIIDYKSAAVPPARSKCTPNPDDYCKMKNFQMAMYVKLLENPAKENQTVYKVSDALFYSLKKGSSGTFAVSYVIDSREEEKKDRAAFDGIFRKSQKDELTVHPDQNAMKVFDEYCRFFADSIASFNIEIGNAVKDKNYVHKDTDCISCRYKSLCRTAFNVAGRKNEKKRGDE